MASEHNTNTEAEEGQGFRFPLHLALVALGLGLGVEILFDGQTPGISFPIWSGLCVIALLGMARHEQVKPAWASAWLALPIMLLSIMVPLRLEPLCVFLNVVLTMALFAVWVRTFRVGGWIRFGWIDIGQALTWIPIESVIRPWGLLAGLWRRSVDERGTRGKAIALVRGVLLALPVVVVFAALLSAADLIFADYLERAINWLDLERLADWTRRLVVVAGSGVFFLGAIVAALRQPGERRPIGEERPIVAPFLGLTEAAIILASVDLLFAVFVAIQFAYLFGGQTTITAAGYTYSEYARRGFGELVAVSVLTLGLIMVLGAVTRRAEKVHRRWFGGLSGLLVALVGVILASALMRLLLYEGAYGFTRLRTYTHVAIFWMGALFLSFLVLLVANRIRAFAPIAALGAVGFSLSLSLMNVDRFIVRQNIARYDRTGKIDAAYLLSLSEDAIPSLVRFAESAPKEVRDDMLPILACRRQWLARQDKERGWPSYHISSANAKRALGDLAADLDAYQVLDGGTDWFPAWRVVSKGEEKSCSSGWRD